MISWDRFGTAAVIVAASDARGIETAPGIMPEACSSTFRTSMRRALPVASRRTASFGVTLFGVVSRWLAKIPLPHVPLAETARFPPTWAAGSMLYQIPTAAPGDEAAPSAACCGAGSAAGAAKRPFPQDPAPLAAVGTTSFGSGRIVYQIPTALGAMCSLAT